MSIRHRKIIVLLSILWASFLILIAFSRLPEKILRIYLRSQLINDRVSYLKGLSIFLSVWLAGLVLLYFLNKKMNLFKQKQKNIEKLVVTFFFSFAVSFLVFYESSVFPFTLDDSYIIYRYAENFAKHGEINWNVGEKPVDGYVNFLWVLLESVFFKLGIDIVVATKIVGIIFSFINLILIYYLALFVLKKEFFAIVPVVLTALCPGYAIWAIGGLETQMATFFLLLACHLFLKEEEKQGFPISGLAFGFLALTRFEYTVLFFVTACYKIFTGFVDDAMDRRWWGRYFLWVFLFASIFLPFFFWKLGYYGHLLPNAGFLKKFFVSSVWYFQICYVGLFFVYNIILVIFSSIGLLLNKCNRVHVYLALMIGIIASVILNVYPLTGLYDRFFVPIFPFFSILAASGIRAVFTKKGKWIVFVVSLLLFHFIFAAVMKGAKDVSGANVYFKSLSRVHIPLGKALKGSVPHNTSIAVVDCGAIPFYSGLRTIDMLGINNEYIARHREDADYVLSQKPGIIILISCSNNSLDRAYFDIERKIAKHPKFSKDYLLVGISESLLVSHPYYLWIFKRSDLKLDVEKFKYAGFNYTVK